MKRLDDIISELPAHEQEAIEARTQEIIESYEETHMTETWGDLLKALQKLTPEQLKQKAQIIKYDCNSNIIAGMPAVCLGTIKALEYERFRSATDNRNNRHEVALMVDENPFALDGAFAYELTDDGQIPIYPDGHGPDCDWTNK